MKYFFLFAILLSGCTGQDWSTNYDCKPDGLAAKVEEALFGDDYWVKQLGLVDSYVKGLDKEYLHRAQELKTLDSSFKTTLNQKIIEFQIDGISEDVISKYTDTAVSAHTSDVEFKVRYITEIMPDIYQRMRVCERKIFMSLPRSLRAKHKHTKSRFFSQYDIGKLGR